MPNLHKNGCNKFIGSACQDFWFGVTRHLSIGLEIHKYIQVKSEEWIPMLVLESEKGAQDQLFPITHAALDHDLPPFSDFPLAAENEIPGFIVFDV